MGGATGVKGVSESKEHCVKVLSWLSFLTFSTPDRHDPVLCTGLHLLPTGLHALLLVPTESL